jgi:hypothetical protein
MIRYLVAIIGLIVGVFFLNIYVLYPLLGFASMMVIDFLIGIVVGRYLL